MQYYKREGKKKLGSGSVAQVSYNCRRQNTLASSLEEFAKGLAVYCAANFRTCQNLCSMQLRESAKKNVDQCYQTRPIQRCLILPIYYYQNIFVKIGMQQHQVVLKSILKNHDIFRFLKSSLLQSKTLNSSRISFWILRTLKFAQFFANIKMSTFFLNRHTRIGDEEEKAAGKGCWLKLLKSIYLKKNTLNR